MPRTNLKKVASERRVVARANAAAIGLRCIEGSDMAGRQISNEAERAG